ncbi:DUF6296 family protein [Kitasatospora sp. DSM 101779]|uniref:DUF6296 family protein n=1 Tax=Kitasatospora sp. DSM 101779 TaxID=2853165 RepID=UPI0021D95BC9|nr:DUF6296 family protein [Kitasatospora sp. DSM 101779]MCU7821251.1 hypothetical protein [Kitasatospora sp. DSM 101779]
MPPTERYAVTLPTAPGTHAPPQVVIVSPTGTFGPDGRPVYADESGTLLFQVAAGGVAVPLAGCPGTHACLHAVPMP